MTDDTTKAGAAPAQPEVAAPEHEPEPAQAAPATPPPGLEPTRRKLVAATIGLAAERGLDGFSVRDVAARAGVGKSLVGHHFGNRAGLLAAVAAELLQAPEIDETDEPLAALAGYCRGLVLQVEADPVRARALFLLLSAVQTEASQRSEAVRWQLQALVGLRKLITRGIAAGEIRKDCTASDDAFVALALTHGALWMALARDYAGPRLAHAADALTDSLIRYFIAPVSPTPSGEPSTA